MHLIRGAIDDMNCRRFGGIFMLILCAGATHCASGQVLLTGMVADSSSMLSLPDVNIISKMTGQGTVTDLRGGFSIRASQGDTLIFSRVGYITKRLPVSEVSEMVIIFLAEEERMLESVEIRSKQNIPWLPPLPPESPWKNSAATNSFAETPGFQGVQTFGPGYVFKGAFSRFSREERERRKLTQVQEENYRARDYVSLVNDPEVKGKIMREHKLTEDEYYRLLAKFNEENQGIIYRLEGHEIVALLVRFYSEQADEKVTD